MYLFWVFCSAIAFGHCVNLTILTVNRRFGGNKNYDYYFTCKACCGSLTWKIDGEGVLSYKYADHDVGKVRADTSQQGETIDSAAILLVKSNTSQGMCLTSLLLVVRPSMQDITITCEGKNTTDNVSTSGHDLNNSTQIRNNSYAEIELVSSQERIYIDEYDIYIYMCRASGAVSWLVNGIVLGSSDNNNSIVHTQNSEVVYASVVLVDNITSLLVLTDYIYNRTDAVLCPSDSRNITFEVPQTVPLTPIAMNSSTTDSSE